MLDRINGITNPDANGQPTPAPAPTPRDMLLRRMIRLCEAAAGASAVGLLPIRLRIEHAGLVASLLVSIAPPRRAADSLWSRIYSALKNADAPIKGTTLAHRLGSNYSGHFREILARLVRERIVRRTMDHRYFLSDGTPEGGSHE